MFLSDDKDGEVTEQSGGSHQPAAQRVNASASVSFFQDETGKTKLQNLYQRSSAKIRLPKVYGDFAEGVLINTAGGLTGGDKIEWSVTAGKGTKAVITTQACEKSYKSSHGIATVSTNLKVEKSATLHWLPQETILYNQSALQRRFNVALTADSRFIAFEAVVLGRQAMGETVIDCIFKDRWRITHDDKLIFADDVKITADQIRHQANNAGLAGNFVLASLFYSGPESDEELQVWVDRLRGLLKKHAGGLSAFNGKITGRFLMPDAYALRQQLIAMIHELTGQDVPKVWRL